MAQKAVLTSGSFAEEFAGIEAVATHHGNNHEVLVARFYKLDRAPVFDLVGRLEFEAVSEDRRVVDALAHARAHQCATPAVFAGQGADTQERPEPRTVGPSQSPDLQFSSDLRELSTLRPALARPDPSQAVSACLCAPTGAPRMSRP
ncbi:hypothetical protein ABZS95_38455 [Streptomyces sp. NPDC005479]|uniref:hypothetical protein n=1 Tax=unclassified Streptomyces TaxID=2593676 RepID=UPI0033BBD3A4